MSQLSRISRQEAETIRKNGQKQHGKALFFQFIVDKEGRSVVTPVVSKKIAKTAVVRNRLKRQIRGIFHNECKESDKSVRMIATVKPGAKVEDTTQMKQDLAQFFRFLD